MRKALKGVRRFLLASFQEWVYRAGIWWKNCKGCLWVFVYLLLVMLSISLKDRVLQTDQTAAYPINPLLSMVLDTSIPLNDWILPANLSTAHQANFLLSEFLDLLFFGSIAAVLYWVIKIICNCHRKEFSIDWGLGLRGHWWAYLFLGVVIGILARLVYIFVLKYGGYWRLCPSFGVIMPTAVVAAMFNALSEELLFRAFLFQVLRRWTSPLFALLTSSILFAVPHVSKDMEFAQSISIFVTACFAGVMFAHAYSIKGNLWLPVGLHFSWNYAGSILNLVLRTPISPELDSVVSIGIIGFLIMIFSEWRTWQQSNLLPNARES